jgi:hypothetical protein
MADGAQPSGIDWTAGVRRERRREGWGLFLTALAVVAVLLVRFDPTSPDERGFVIGFAVFVLALALGAATWFVAGVRSGRTDRYRLFYALREHVDPGPGLRARADDVARQQKLNRWGAWLAPLALALQLVEGRWDEPAIAVPGTVVFAVCVLTIVWWQQRLGAAAHRWLRDPPGPSRRPDAER